MTFPNKTLNNNFGSPDKGKILRKSPANLALFKNGDWMLDSAVKNNSVSEDYYQHEWGQESRENEQSGKGRCKFNFNFNSIKVPLFETFGIIVSIFFPIIRN